SLVITLALAAWPRRRPASASDEPAWVPLDQRPAMALAWSLDRVRRYEGTTPTAAATAATIIGATIAGWAVAGALGAVALLLAAAATTRWSRARPLLTVGGPALFLACVAWMVGRQQFGDLPAGF